MNGAEQKRHNMEKQMPGCMGMVVNLFDFGPNISGNRLLTDKAHQERYPPSRGLPDGAKKLADPVDNCTKDDCSAYTSKGHLSNRKSNETPMKMLVAQLEPDSKLKSPSVVARLMGLDAFPPQEQAQKLEGLSPSRYSQDNARKYEAGPRNWQNGNNFLQSSAHETQDFKDVYEVQHQSPKASRTRVLQKAKQNNDLNEKIAFVRQKFMEAKRLSVDSKLRQSKQFQDALDALSSNRDAFLKFLQEPNSLPSTHLYELPYVAPSTERKRITVLKPAKAVEVKGEKTMKKQLSSERSEWNKGHRKQSGINVQHRGDNTVWPTRIVVLKPSPGKNLDIKSFSSPASPKRSVHGPRDCNEGYGIDDSKESRETAKEITWQMRKRLSKSCGDDSFFSSALSNEYFGDQSSLNKSDNDYEEENFSDSGMVTPYSRHSWDYINKFGSPFSSSFGRTSYSPESSVSKEAKKRLLERQILIESNGNETHQVHRKSSTLGEMLSLPEAKMSILLGNEAEVSRSSGYFNKIFGEEQEHGLPSLCLSNGENKDECMDSFPRNLVRSRSAPLSSNMHETCGSNIEILEYKNSSPKETSKPKSGKSSIKGKVSSFFLSRNKKSDKTRSASTSIIGTQDVLRSVDISNAKQVPLATKHDDNSTRSSTRFDNERVILHVEEAICETSSSLRHESLSREGPTPLAKTESFGQYGENQEQPSPISVLDAPFNELSTTQSGENVDIGQSSNLCLPKSCEAATKSPLIESVTRSLTWDNRALEASSSISSGYCTVEHLRQVAQQREWFLYIQSILAAASLDDENSNFVFTKWHSSESPLDPSLCEKCTFWQDDEQVTEAKRIQRISDRKLMFDLVNAALSEVVTHTSSAKEYLSASRKTTTMARPVSEEVWCLIKEWSFSEPKICGGESENGLVVENAVREKVVGRHWEDLTRLEVDITGKDLEKKILEEIMDEVLAEIAS